jgi:hypothetical protein
MPSLFLGLMMYLAVASITGQFQKANHTSWPQGGRSAINYTVGFTHTRLPLCDIQSTWSRRRASLLSCSLAGQKRFAVTMTFHMELAVDALALSTHARITRYQMIV